MTNNMLRLRAFVDRDLKKFRRNPLVLAMSIPMPIIYLIIIGNSFQGKLHALPLVIVNKDSGPYSRRIMENLHAIEAGMRTIVIFASEDEEDALAGVRRGRYKAGLIIPNDFSRKAVLNSRPEVGLFLDNTDTISSEAIKNAIFGALQSVGSDYVSIREKSGTMHLREINLYNK